MIDVDDNNAAYYYHFDGLGSVVALSNSNGDSCQSYEYSAYGQVAASDPNFLTNPYMFTGRRFDIETGLYYYRARYYNPHIGRFMQTDPVGYGDGINWYLYCRNNPLAFVDPSGLNPTFGDPYFAPSDSSDVFPDVCDVCDVIICETPELELAAPSSAEATMFLPVIFLGEGAMLVEGLSLAGKAGLAVGAAKGVLIAGTAYVFYEIGTEIGEPIAVPLATGIAFV
jgi:RHS repeat-associated protein